MTLSQFFHMGGYAFYVWTSYGLALVVLLINLLLPRWRHRQVRETISQTFAKEQRS